MKINYNRGSIEIDEETNKVSVAGKVDPNWVVTSTLDDNQQGVILGVHNTKSGEFVSTAGEVKYVTNEEDL